jgi:hypothetical protein
MQGFPISPAYFKHGNMKTLLMPFIDESESFTNGFECGQIWQRISEGETIANQLIHWENAEQIKRICETFGLSCEITQWNETWAYLTVFSILQS